jgi:hypothetical protein
METLERLIAVEAIRELKARYCRLADFRYWEAFSQLFTPEGTMRFFDPAGSLLSEVHGRTEIIAKLTKSVGKAQPIHHVFSAEIDVLAPTTAKALWAMEDQIIQPEGSKASFRTMRGYGHYHEQYRCIDSHWLIEKLELTRIKLEFN